MKISNSDPMLTRQWGNPDVMLTRQYKVFNPVLTRQLKLVSAKGVSARAIKTTPEQRKEIASIASKARWSKEKENNGTIRPQ